MHTRAGFIGVLLFALTSVAAEPVGRAAIRDDLLGYYGGERNSAYFVLGHGVVSTGLGAYLVTQRSPSEFSRGLGWTLIPVGALELLGGISYAVQVSREIDHYEGSLSSDAAKFKDEELAHLGGTRSRFIYYRLFEASLTAAGLGFGAYGLLANRDSFKGVGLGLFAAGAPLLVMDTINNNRAHSYVERLSGFDPALAINVSDHGWTVGLASRF